MPLPVRDVVGILADNLRLRGSVLPIPAHRATAWARDLGIPRGGETVLYTGQMYQVIPYIERLVRLEQRLGDSPLARFSGVARLLQRAGVAFGYLYEDDLYSLVRAHDLGEDEAVAAHARRVAGIFPQARCSPGDHPRPPHHDDAAHRLPHAGGGVRRARAQLPRGAGRARAAGGRPPQPDGRHPRLVRLRPLRGDRRRAAGAAAESLFPTTAAAIAGKRVAQLRAVAPDCVTMCPICLVNLRKAANGTMRLRDISDHLLDAVAERSASAAHVGGPTR